MDAYQQEQRTSFESVRSHLTDLKSRILDSMAPQLAAYLAFRSETDQFLKDCFGRFCQAECYQNQRSACCTKDGIITFFADVVVNLLQSTEPACERLAARLNQPHSGPKCLYLGPDGCLWTIKPIVCQMFVCDEAQKQVFTECPPAAQNWQRLLERKKAFTWPDQPILFDDIESLFLEAGCTSPLMYLHNSPGLLRIKQKAGLNRFAKPITNMIHHNGPSLRTSGNSGRKRITPPDGREINVMRGERMESKVKPNQGATDRQREMRSPSKLRK